MATYVPTDNITNSTSFIQQLDETRISIQQVFRDLIEKLQLREATLLKQLEDIKSDYELNSLETKRELNALQAQRDFTAQNLKLNQLKEFQQQQVEQLNQMISKLEMEDGEERSISWSWDSQLIEAISAVGKLEVITLGRAQQIVKPSLFDCNTSEQQQIPIAIDYKQKVKPVISKCRDGSNDGDLKSPRGVAVDMNTGKIFIVDVGNNCVNVYTSDGDFLFKFGDKLLNFPHLICIYDAMLFVTHNNGIIIFHLDGHLLNKIGGLFSFNHPHGITISPLNSDIYICDTFNHKVQIYDSKEFKYKSTIGKGSLNYPKDIIFAQYVYILDDRDPCLHVYTTEHVYVRSFISRGLAKQVCLPYCFHIDNNCNILITDYMRHCLCIFTNIGELLHQIGGGESSDMYYPTGVTIDKDGRIIIVNPESNAELIFCFCWYVR